MLGNILTIAIIIAYDTTMAQVLPTWVYVFGAFTIWFYQTMDAVDGKQARRTGTSGPLGQLFDHGCDAVTCTLACSIYFQATMMGTESNLQSLFFFYLSSHVSSHPLDACLRSWLLAPGT